jgi:hypothetical protein
MAATDLSGEALPAVGFLTKRVTLDATANNAREIILPTWARRVSIFVLDGTNTEQKGALASSGTDGASIGNRRRFDLRLCYDGFERGTSHARTGVDPWRARLR